MLSAMRVFMINSESIIPSKHNRDDIRCER